MNKNMNEEVFKRVIAEDRIVISPSTEESKKRKGRG
jgi:hypothetical protein